MTLWDFREVSVVDFEFSAPEGEPPHPICLVARQLKSGRTLRLWEDDLRRLPQAPYPTDQDSLVVAYYASAEVGCHLSLKWRTPANVLDLFVEFRNLTNGRQPPCGNSLLGALAWFGLDGIDAADKAQMRDLALRGGPWTAHERRALLDYCEADVNALTRLLGQMESGIDLPRALLRGRYMVAAARIEAVGIPIDTEEHLRLVELWPDIGERLIGRMDQRYDVFDGRTFKSARWAEFLAQNNIPWPRLPSGALALDDDTFREMARTYPQVAPMRELRVALSQMRLADLAVGQDGRNRCLLSAFRARTGRNQPSNSRFIFGPAVWIRSLIKPAAGWGLAYIDWAQQELGIAAALSGDEQMLAAYRSGDPYMSFAKQAGAAPRNATKKTHRTIREQFKACALAVQYGMGEKALGQRLGQATCHARELLRHHHETYRTFWQWSDASIDVAYLHLHLSTTFGWTLHVGPNVNSRSVRNFPMQANGAEMLRLACCLITEHGIRLCAPIHDAVLIEARLEELDDAVAVTQRLMADASRIVLQRLALRSDVTVIRYPDRFEDPRGQAMWQTISEVIQEIQATEVCARAT